MYLTGKCKEDFEKWYRENDNEFCVGYPNGREEEQSPCSDFSYCEDFYDLPLSYQLGVLQDFFDEQSIWITVEALAPTVFDVIVSDADYKYSSGDECVEAREAARIIAIQTANKLYNTRPDGDKTIQGGS